MRKTSIDEILRNRILFIGGKGEGIPEVATEEGVQVYLGSPDSLIKELEAFVSLVQSSERAEFVKMWESHYTASGSPIDHIKTWGEEIDKLKLSINGNVGDNKEEVGASSEASGESKEEGK